MRSAVFDQRYSTSCFQKVERLYIDTALCFLLKAIFTGFALLFTVCKSYCILNSV
jgi:hypothetical protein